MNELHSAHVLHLNLTLVRNPDRNTRLENAGIGKKQVFQRNFPVLHGFHVSASVATRNMRGNSFHHLTACISLHQLCGLTDDGSQFEIKNCQMT